MSIATRTITIQQPVTVTEPDFTRNIRRGAELLDERFGTDWRDGVDTSGLDLSDVTTCVLGQVFVTSIVNGAVRTVAGREQYYGGLKFLFPDSSYAHLNVSVSMEAEKAASHHGFVLLDEDVNAWNEAHGTEHSVQSMYEVLTAQWVEFLTPPDDDEDY